MFSAWVQAMRHAEAGGLGNVGHGDTLWSLLEAAPALHRHAGYEFPCHRTCLGTGIQYQHSPRFADSAEHGLPIEGADRAQVDKLARDAVLTKVIHRMKRLYHHVRHRDDRHIVTLPKSARLAERDALSPLGDFPDHVMQPAMLQEQYRVVVKNAG